MKAIAIILAAGESSRMGVPKALLDAGDGVSFLGRLAEIFEQARASPLVVLGAQADQIRAAHPTLHSVLNPRWPQGQLSSVQVGIRAALLQGARRILIHPVDAPLISALTATRVLAALVHSAAVIATCDGLPGHPLGLQAEAARTLLTSSAPTLAGAALQLQPQLLAVEDPLILDNLNTPEAYRLRFGHNPRPV